MQLKFEKGNYGKLALIGATTLMRLLILVLFKAYGYQATWELRKIPAWRLPLLEFRLIPGSTEFFHSGYELSLFQK